MSKNQSAIAAPCGECGMPCTPGEYHPFAACLMFKQCHNSTTVRAILDTIRAAPPAQSAPDTERLREMAGKLGDFLRFPTKSGRLWLTYKREDVLRILDEEYKARTAAQGSDDLAILEAVRRELNKGHEDGNAPGHAHSVPGIWDSDNGALAGNPCAWCLTWGKFTGIIAAMSAKDKP